MLKAIISKQIITSTETKMFINIYVLPSFSQFVYQHNFKSGFENAKIVILFFRRSLFKSWLITNKKTAERKVRIRKNNLYF